MVLSALDKATAGYKAVYQLVRRLGFRWKRGTKRLNRIDPVARAEFAETVQRLADEANRGERTLIYIDEAHIHCDLDEGYGWAWGGEPYEISSSSPGLSKKVSLYGAFVFNDPQVVLWKAPRCNTMFTLAFLFHLARVVVGKPKPTIVWDGAPWHKPSYMRTIAEKVLGFELVMLPAYSPDFMPVEALWRWLREEVTRNQCHDTVEALVDDVIKFGRHVNEDPLGLITRLWPKLELREKELPQQDASSGEDVAGWHKEPSDPARSPDRPTEKDATNSSLVPLDLSPRENATGAILPSLESLEFWSEEENADAFAELMEFSSKEENADAFAELFDFWVEEVTCDEVASSLPLPFGRMDRAGA